MLSGEAGRVGVTSLLDGAVVPAGLPPTDGAGRPIPLRVGATSRRDGLPTVAASTDPAPLRDGRFMLRLGVLELPMLRLEALELLRLGALKLRLGALFVAGELL